ncbi:MAG: hypothetical protein EA391_13520 [Balneolaceae bacterium]|nr:MAG: hypothetical protein EA391_13520 [Balneolaceae bacterium]
MAGNELKEYIFNSGISFADRLKKVYNYQVVHNPVYRDFSNVFGFNEDSDIDVESVPLLPIRAFQLRKITTDSSAANLIFKSSGTTGVIQSTHHVADKSVYEAAISEAFYSHFPQEIYALLCSMPGYLDNPYSSLIWMATFLIKNDSSGLSKMYHDIENPDEWISDVLSQGKIPLLFGAAFGLLDLIDQKKINMSNQIEIIETGGMKTHRREMSKEELRKHLSDGFNVDPSKIHSEYGMCELLSQMYAISGEWFTTPHWVTVTIRDPKNPDRICEPGEEGKIGIIDLANFYSCPFILTEDKGIRDETGRFRVLGRWSSDNLRGCNFLIDRD